MRTLFTFPSQDNETSVRLVAGAVAVLTVLTLAFQQGRLLPVLAYGFLARVLTGPTLSPLGLVATRVVTWLVMRFGLLPTSVCENCAR